MSGIAELVIIIGAILFSITVHEAMHAYASYWLGDDTAMMLGRLSLNPLKHIDIFTTVILPLLLVISGLPPFGAAKPVPFNPARLQFGEFGAAIVGLAGPLTNLAIAIILGLWLKLLGGLDGSVVADIMALLIQVNLAFFIFNMIPWPPLDGSRLLYALAPDGVRQLMSQIEATGLIGIAIFVIVFLRFLSPVINNIFINLYNLIV